MTFTSPEIRGALHLIDEGFDRPGWHGPNLLGSLRGMTLPELLFRPDDDAHNAWELALHCAYWKHVIQNRLVPASQSAFGIKGSNFFRRDETSTPTDWKADLDRLKRAHVSLRAIVAGLKVKNLGQKLPTSRHTYRRTVFGIAAHDIYHAGQISLLRKLAKS